MEYRHMKNKAPFYNQINYGMISGILYDLARIYSREKHFFLNKNFLDNNKINGSTSISIPLFIKVFTR